MNESGTHDEKVSNDELRMIGRQVLEHHPDLAAEILEQVRPTIADMETLDRLADVYNSILYPFRPISSKERSNYRLVMMAAALKLYDPGAFFGLKQYARPGLRLILGELFDLSPVRISEYLKKSRDLYGLDKPFTREVDELYRRAFLQYHGFKKAPREFNSN